jgi:general transcription factor IIIA
MREYRCEVCGGMFANASRLSRHKRTHTGERPYSCPWPSCGIAYSRSEHLNRHLMTHTDQRPFKCNHEGCHKAFNTKQRLQRHNKSHIILSDKKKERLKRITCTLSGCEGTRLANWTQLRIHLKSVHGLEHFCKAKGCVQAFQSEDDLLNHQEAWHGKQTSEKPMPKTCPKKERSSIPGRKPKSLQARIAGMSYEEFLRIVQN